MDYALVANQIAVGTFFAISGYHKLTNHDRHATLVKTLQDCHVPFIRFNQWWVPANELLCGIAVACGFKLAAIPLIIICLVAVCTDGIKRIKEWQPIDKADALDDVLYLPEVLYMIMLSIVLTGAF